MRAFLECTSLSEQWQLRQDGWGHGASRPMGLPAARYHFRISALFPLFPLIPKPWPSTLLFPGCPQTSSSCLALSHPSVWLCSAPASLDFSPLCFWVSMTFSFYVMVFFPLPAPSPSPPCTFSLSWAGNFLCLICAPHQPCLLKSSSFFTFKSPLKCLALWEIFPNLSKQRDRLSQLGPETQAAGLLLHVLYLPAFAPCAG